MIKINMLLVIISLLISSFSVSPTQLKPMNYWSCQQRPNNADASVGDTSVIYNLNLNDIDGNPIDLNQFQGKKILIVNTATNSNYANQFDSLEELYQKYKDSIVIIAIPSNSFGNESRDNVTIKDFVTSNYNVHYILAQKTDVTGDAQSSLYAWLTHIEQNGMMNNQVQDDFFKFLIDGSGRLVGVFTASVEPMGNDIQSAIITEN